MSRAFVFFLLISLSTIFFTPASASAQTLPISYLEPQNESGKVVVRSLNLTSTMRSGQKWGSLKAGYFCGPFRNLYWGTEPLKLEFKELEGRLKPIIANAFIISHKNLADYIGEVDIVGDIVSADAKLCSFLADLGNFNSVKGTISFAINWTISAADSGATLYTFQSNGAIVESKFNNLGIQELFYKTIEDAIKNATQITKF